MLFVPSLNPIRFRGVDCAAEVVDVRPNPSCDHRSTAVPRAMRAKLRMTWKATCGSFEQAWTQRSPPVRADSSRSPGSPGRRPQVGGGGRAMLRQAEPVVEERGAKPDRDRQVGRTEAERLAGVDRR